MIFSSCSRLWPLATKSSRRKLFSVWRVDGEEHSRWALQSSPLKMAVAVLGSWHEWGFIVRLVLDGLR